jgi:4-hydroxy-L-threonine phosphate dehydrogenase PdxA
MKIAVAIGDPNGIGPEIAVKAAALFQKSTVEVILVGDRHVIEHYGNSSRMFAVDALSPDAFSPGKLDPRAGRATVAYVRAAVSMVERGEADAIVACPQSETAINRAGIAFNGYAGLLAELTGTPRDKTFLMLIAAGLRIAHVTLHESVQSALSRMTPELVVDAGIAAAAILERLKIRAPKLGVFGINPHAGEDGLFGDHDERITKPAVAELRRRGIEADGPIGADLLLAQRKHDAYLAMFHDQGHIPVKLLSPLRSSALSIGTPVLFSSVGHGCAYDIAGKGVADPASVVETLRLLGGLNQSASPIPQ